MTTPTREQLSQVLNRIRDPKSGRGVVEAGLIQGLVVKEGRVGFMIEVAADVAPLYESVRAACEKAARAVRGVEAVTAVLTAEGSGGAPRPARASAGLRKEVLPERGTHAQALPGVGAIVAVASGKGGVGKSTVAVNLALALTRLGKRVGLMDADIYGPSVPHLLGLSGRPRSADGKMLEPMERYGLKAMSIGFLIDRDAPAVWRGPVATGALHQLLTQVSWGDLDVLVIDMPPGTGDIHLSLAQRVALTGAIIVSTPQDIALLDARKGIAMFRKVEVPVLGVIENMSLYVCPNCGHEAHLFGHGGARKAAAELETEFLGEIPLHLSIREGSDDGAPVVAAHPAGAEARAFIAIAERVAAQIDAGVASRPPPRIVII